MPYMYIYCKIENWIAEDMSINGEGKGLGFESVLGSSPGGAVYYIIT